MLSQSTLLHLRIPFSFFLLPVFCFAVSVAQPSDWSRTIWAFFILHFLVYPASNAYNSYYDKDEDSIGGLENPPPVSRELLYVSLAMDFGAVLLGLLVSFWFALGLLLYGLASKAYSYDKIRLKKYPITSWLVIGFFQGFFTFLLIYQGILNVPLSELGSAKVYLGGTLSSLMLLGSYPMTQVYQHQEDAKRGDLTLSRLLGIRGTFLFTMLVFGSVGGLYFWYFWAFYAWQVGLIFELSLLPVVVYFMYWFYKVWQNPQNANFKSTMRLNLISAICMNLFFSGLYFF
ncbi:MAG: UbiA family prenyltransferase [Microscillaceae bacterium]|jgi:1,4-dihydroxy-2-naphthoate octaprenyltransferase|nr:UbiA family prenyltransferase [Microscillaceae bacterium]